MLVVAEEEQAKQDNQDYQVQAVPVVEVVLVMLLLELMFLQVHQDLKILVVEEEPVAGPQEVTVVLVSLLSLIQPDK